MFIYFKVIIMKNKSNIATIKSTETKMELVELKPIVISPSNSYKWRAGKGYSYKEIRAADIPIDDLKKVGVPIDKRRKSLHQKNVDELATFYRQLVANKTLTTYEKETETIKREQTIKHLTKLPEISKKDAEILIEGGILTISHLAEEDPELLANDLDIDLNIVKKWVESAKSIKLIIDAKSAYKKFSKINGIKKKYIKSLLELGIADIDNLLDANPEKIAEKLDLNIDEVLFWIDQAKNIKNKGDVGTEKIESEQKKIIPKKKKGDIEISETAESELAVDKLVELETGPSEIETEIQIPQEEIKLKAEEELLKCKGIGKKTAEKLIESGIFSLEELVKADITELEKLSGISKSKLEKYQKSAKELL